MKKTINLFTELKIDAKIAKEIINNIKHIENLENIEIAIILEVSETENLNKVLDAVLSYGRKNEVNVINSQTLAEYVEENFPL